MIKKRIGSVVGALMSLCMASQAFALGGGNYSVDLTSVRGSGEGDTGVAGVYQDPIASYMNPAALTSIPGTKMTIGGSYLNLRASAVGASAASAPGNPLANNGGEASAHATSVFIPAFGISTMLNDKIGLGLSLNSPYGTETHWDLNSPMRYVATDSKLHILLLSPAVAYKVTDQFSAGVGIDYANTTDGVLGKQINQAAFGGPNDASSRLNANGDGWGYHFGLQYKPTEQHAIGLTYHSMIKMNLSGTAQLSGLSGFLATGGGFGGPNFSTNISAPIYLPENIQIGYSFTPNEQWQFEIDGAWYDWQSANKLGIKYAGLNGFQSTVLNTNNPQQFNTRNTLSLALGANYKQNDKLQWRGGFWYQGASSAESGFDPAIPDLPRTSLTAGGSYQFTPMLGVDWAYQVQWMHTRYVSNPTLGIPSGTSFSDFAQELSAALTVKLPGFGGSK